MRYEYILILLLIYTKSRSSRRVPAKVVKRLRYAEMTEKLRKMMRLDDQDREELPEEEHDEELRYFEKEDGELDVPELEVVPTQGANLDDFVEEDSDGGIYDEITGFPIEIPCTLTEDQLNGVGLNDFPLKELTDDKRKQTKNKNDFLSGDNFDSFFKSLLNYAAEKQVSHFYLLMQ
jgi:hypothetical protein